MIPANALNIGYDKLSKMANFGKHRSIEVIFSIKKSKTGHNVIQRLRKKYIYTFYPRFNIDISLLDF